MLTEDMPLRPFPSDQYKHLWTCLENVQRSCMSMNHGVGALQKIIEEMINAEDGVHSKSERVVDNNAGSNGNQSDNIGRYSELLNQQIMLEYSIRNLLLIQFQVNSSLAMAHQSMTR